ncbi:MAG: DUF2147 domain-containing protein [Bacteroidales bacterium]|nr:DUF2147 domain-containing protein [Bacteroidales bacterium]
MRSTILIALSLFLTATAYSQEEAIKAVWQNVEKTSKIRIFKATNGKYYGKIEWTQNADKKDINNPDPKKQNDPIVGLMIIKDFTYDAAKKQWGGGTIYDPDNGKTYDCYMWFEGGKTDVLHLKGYIMGMKFMGRETQFTKIE